MPATDTNTPPTIPPLRIGPFSFWPPVLPAPMCGISDYAWRLLAREQGCPLTYTQMVSSEALIRGNDKCWDLLDLEPGEGPVCVQLMGSEPEQLARSARILVDGGGTFVDLNMGCPAKKIVSCKGGSALMREPDLVKRIFEAIRAAIPEVPFTVKFRAGYDKYGDEAMMVARLAEEQGLDAVAIHGRTREQGYKGPADWAILRDVKKMLHIPVIGNGDVNSAQDALRMIRETGVDGVMVGRGGMGNPWVFGEIVAAFRGLPPPPVPSSTERLDMVARHARLMVERKGTKGLIEFRKHAVQYLHSFRNARALKTKLLNVTDLGEYLRLLEEAKGELELDDVVSVET